MTSLGEAGLAYLRNQLGATGDKDRAERTKEDKALLRIELDDPYIFFRGPAHQTPPQTLRGRLKISSTSQTKVKAFTVTLEGTRNTVHFLKSHEIKAGMKFQNPIFTNRTFIEKVYTIQDTDGIAVTRVPAGEHTFPFEFELPGDLPETVEGLHSARRFYLLHARAHMGTYRKDPRAKRQVRLVRTLSNDMSEEILPTDITGVWPDKLQYSISTNSRAVIYGDRLYVDFELTPLVAKLEIGKITFKLVEVELVRTEPGPQNMPELGLGDFWRRERDILEKTEAVPEDSGQLNPTTFENMKKFTLSFDLPKSLKECRQSVEYGDWMQFKHHAHYAILLHNSDGHVSELKVHHPIRLFISPSMPIGDECYVTRPVLAPGTTSLMQSALEVPPVYGTHVTDIPVNPFVGLPMIPSVVASAVNTPGLRSGAATPGLTQSQASSSNSPTGAPHGSELQARLAALAAQEANAQSAESRGPGARTPPRAQGFDYDMEMMSRVVSYGVATQHSAVPEPLAGSFPPTYTDATGMSGSSAAASLAAATAGTRQTD